MDAEGARELTRRIGSNAPVAPRPLPGTVSEGALPLARWFGGETVGTAPRPTEPPAPARGPWLRRIAFPGR